MKKDKKTNESNFFPDYSYFERAINYPYPTPDYAYSFFKGKFIQGIHLDLEKRIPILSVGSNRAPMQLQRKFSFNQDICVTPAILYDSDIVYAASIAAYGSMPATQWPSIGTEVDLNVLWLTEKQLHIMHLTEAVGVAYNFVKMKSGTVKIKDFQFSGDIYGYVSVAGAFPFKLNAPFRLAAILSSNTKLKAIYEEVALDFLMKFLEPDQTILREWIKEVIQDQDYRLQLHKKLKSIAIKPDQPNWETIDININDEMVL
jgi:hypothetical protein